MGPFEQGPEYRTDRLLVRQQPPAPGGPVDGFLLSVTMCKAA